MTYLVALSGGADSVALLLHLLESGLHVEAAHCNFQLRGAESQRDEDFVRRLCQQRGVVLHVRHFDTQAEARLGGESIEMAARRLRYAWFEELRKQRGLDLIAVAHHRDDNVETILLHLCRGTGLRGLCGMQPLLGHLARPLLGHTRAELLDYLARRGQDYVTDSTNADTRFKRNLIRHELLPLLRRLNPAVDEALLRLARHAQEAEELVGFALRQTVERIVSQAPHGFNIDCAALASAPAPRTVLHHLLTPLGFPPESQEGMLAAAREELEAAHTRRALFCSPTHQAVFLRGQLQVRHRPEPLAGDEITWTTEQRPPRAEGSCAWPLPAWLRSPRHACLDQAALRGKLSVRRLEAGERFVPFGRKSAVLVSDYLTARHLSRLDREHQLCLADREGIVWLAGHTVAQRVAVGAQTQAIVLCTLH